jgi:hypothetical protein
MPVGWQIRGEVLTLTVRGVVDNHEIESALAEGLESVEPRTGVRLLWDARESETPLTTEDMAWRIELVCSLAERAVFFRGALLVREDQSLLLDMGRNEMKRALRGLDCDAFSDEAAALAWLNAGEGRKTPRG